MKRFTRFLAVAIAIIPAAAWAQTSVSAGASVLSDYVLRGVTSTNSLVVQPDLAVVRPFAGGSFTFGAFANIEPSRRVGPNDLSQAGGVRSGLAEVDVWADYGRDFGGVHAVGGALVYSYDQHNATATSALNTTELYGKFSLPAVSFAPELRAYWDVRTIHGWYAEGQLTRVLPVAGRDWTLATVAGVSVGQERQSPADTYYFFTQPGLTHVDVSVTTTFTVGRFTAAPVLHVQYSPNGQNSRVAGALATRQDQATRLWFGVRFGGLGTVGSAGGDAAARESK